MIPKNMNMRSQLHVTVPDIGSVGLQYFAKRNETKRNGTLRNGTLRNGTLRNGTLRNGTLTKTFPGFKSRCTRYLNARIQVPHRYQSLPQSRQCNKSSSSET